MESSEANISFIHRAFVLKAVSSYHHMIALIDCQDNRTNIIYRKGPLISGSLIEYYMPKNPLHPIDRIDPVYVPLLWGKNDLLFIHHILELCYYFIPLNGSCTSIFNMLLILIKMEEASWSDTTKKIFIVKLLILYGMYPKTRFTETTFFQKLLTIRPENLLTLDSTCDDMAYIDQWIKQTLSEHPMAPSFRTMFFLTRGSLSL